MGIQISWVLVVALMTLTEVKVRSTIHQPLREFWERGSLQSRQVWNEVIFVSYQIVC